MSERDPQSESYTCSICSVEITKQEIASGSAVRMGGALVCPLCIDTLPADAKLRIEQLRALRGMAAKTYRYRLPKFPQIMAYTFSSSAALMNHRRTLNAGKTFDAPLVAPRAKTEPMLTPYEPQHQRSWKGPVLVGGGLAAIAVIALILTFNKPPAKPEPIVEPVAVPEVSVQPVVTRAELPPDPWVAWHTASAELALDDPVLLGLAQEVMTIRTAELNEARAALDQQRVEVAAALVNLRTVPTHPLLRSIERQEQDLVDDIAAAQAAAAAAKRAQELAANTVEPEPEPEPPPALPPPVENTAGQLTATEPDEPVEPTLLAPWISLATELVNAKNPSGWQFSENGSMISTEPSAFLSRPVEIVSAGQYRLWLALGSEHAPDAQLLTRFGSTPQALPATNASTDTPWVAAAEAVSLEAGTYALEVIALQGQVDLMGVALTRVDNQDQEPSVQTPDKLIGQNMPWHTPATQEVASQSQIISLSTVPKLKHRFLDPFNFAHRVPDNIPGGIEPQVLASTENRRHQHMILNLGSIDLTGGGMAVLLHPSIHPDRKEIILEFEDVDGNKAKLPPIAINPGQWQVVLANSILITEESFNQQQVVRLRISDVESKISLPFIVAKIAASTLVPPHEDMLELRERALRPLNAQATAELMSNVTRARNRKSDWRTDFDPNKYHVLVGHHMLNGHWQGHFYESLRIHTKQDTPRGTAKILVLHDPWLDDTFILPPDLVELKYHMAVVASAGIEFPIGLDQDQALYNFWHKMMTETVRTGIFPVVVLGPTKANEEHRALVNHLWKGIDDLMASHHPGIPIIDLRSVGESADTHTFKSGQSKKSADLLAEAIAELQKRLQSMQQMTQRR